MAFIAVVLGALSACGGRTEPFDDFPERERDAGGGIVPTPPFSTLPCRWTLGRESVLAESDRGFARVRAAIHGARDEAIVGGNDSAYVVSLEDPPVLLRTGGELRGDTTSAPLGWVSASSGGPSCYLWQIGDDLELIRRDELTGIYECDISARTPDVLHVFGRTERGARLVSFGLNDARAGAPIDLGADVVALGATGREQGWIAATVGIDSVVTIHRVSPTGAVESARTEAHGRIEDAPDRLRAGLVLLRSEGPTGPWFVERVPFDGDLRLERVADLAPLGGEPVATIATNETEAVVPLRDGRIAIAALNGIEPYTIGPVVDGAAPVRVQVALRSGTSVGGVAYDYSLEGRGPARLAFRALVCNR